MMPDEDELSKFHDHVERQRTFEQNALQYIKQQNDLEAQLRTLWWANEAFALEACFEKNDFDRARLHFFMCARTDEISIARFDNFSILQVAIDHCTYALLCDSADLLQRYSLLASTAQPKLIASGYTLIPLVQAFLRRDRNTVLELLEIAGKKTIRKWKHTQPEYDFLVSCEKKSKKGMIEAIQIILKAHRHRQKFFLYSGSFLSPTALCYAKLAWILGFELEIDHPLVPAELLPVKPIRSYKDYPFMQGLP